MIDIKLAKLAFKKFLKKYQDDEQLGLNLKIVHTYQVMENARMIANSLGLSDEDTMLAELIGLLHDIGRFEELTFFKKFDSVKFNHAAFGVKMLFEDGLIRNFIVDDKYDDIIRVAVFNHNKLEIEAGLNEKSMLFAKIIRDADKLDNFRVKRDEKIQAIFPGILKSEREIEESELSDKVYESVKMNRCVSLSDRITVLDYWVCVLAFVFDLNFRFTFQEVKENNYINDLIDRFNYSNAITKKRMEDVRKIINDYIESRIK